MLSTWQLLAPQVKSTQLRIMTNISAVLMDSLTGGILFTDEFISWHIPRRVTPLTEGKVKIVELYMGINGQRLEKAQIAARGYSLSTTEFHIVVDIPVGSPDGYYKVGVVGVS